MSEMGVRDYEVCGDCIHLSDEKSKIGYKCIHPGRPFKGKAKYFAEYKYRCTASCKRFERRTE